MFNSVTPQTLNEADPQARQQQQPSSDAPMLTECGLSLIALLPACPLCLCRVLLQLPDMLRHSSVNVQLCAKGKGYCPEGDAPGTVDVNKVFLQENMLSDNIAL